MTGRIREKHKVGVVWMFSQRICLVSLAVSVGLSTSGQAGDLSINIDFSDSNGTPSSSFGAAGGTPGFWNSIPANDEGVVFPLNDTSDTTSGVSLRYTAPFGAGLISPSPLPAEFTELLTDGISDAPFATYTVEIMGLPAGVYDLYTYPFVNSPTSFNDPMTVTVDGDTQLVTTNFPGDFELGETHSKHRVNLSAGNSILVTAQATDANGRGNDISGFQIVQVPEPSSLALVVPFMTWTLTWRLGCRRRDRGATPIN